MIARPAVYVTGPLSDPKDPARNPLLDAAERLERLGLEVINPALQPVQDTWADQMRGQIEQLVKYCHTLVYVDGWERCEDTLIELYIASKLGIPCIDINDELNLRRLARGESTLAITVLDTAHVPVYEFDTAEVSPA